MFRTSRKAAAFGLAGVLSVVLVTVAYAVGMWPTLPIVSSSSYCASTVSGVVLPSGQGPYGVVPGSTQGTGFGICGQTVPAGPTALTGNELSPADTELANGVPPATVMIPAPLTASGATQYVGWQTLAALTFAANSYQIPNNITNLALDPSATVADVTLVLPANPLNGQVIRISSSHTLTALAIQGGSVGTVSNAPTAMTVSTTAPYGYEFVFLPAATATNGGATWYRLQ